MSEPCPFCTIVESYPHPNLPSPSSPEEPSYIVLSTDHIIAFLDRLPLTKAHTLLIPRKHYPDLTSIPASISAELGRILPILSRAILKVSGADGFNVIMNNGISAGQVVPHAHFHVVPRFREASAASMFGMVFSGVGLMVGKGRREELEDDVGREVSRELREVIQLEMEKAKL